VTRKRRTRAPAAIDACCLIDLLASGHMEAILQATGYAWHLPVAVQAEVQFVRQHDPAQPGLFVTAPVDLSPHRKSGLLSGCQPDNSDEQSLFVQYATRFRSDGEAMCLAIAESRGWLVATDDRKAIRIANQAGLSVLSSPELVKAWVDAEEVDSAEVDRVLMDIHALARFVPHAQMPDAAWWLSR
jgi:hypothetical protein